MFGHACFLVSLSAAAPALNYAAPVQTSSISVSNVGFASLMADKSLYLSSFTGSPFGSDAGYFIPNAA
ncbi:hypothetical protein HDU91_005815, partial [Kappamyces sp. JEL0680]